MTDEAVGASGTDPDRAAPPAREDVAAFPVADELVLYRDEDATAFSLNRSARSVWELCDGSRTVGQMATELARALGCGGDPDAVELIRADVESLVRDLERRGLLRRPTAA